MRETVKALHPGIGGTRLSHDGSELELTTAVELAERFLLFHSFSVSDDASRALASATFIFGGNREAWEVYRTVQDFWAIRRFGS